MKLDLKCRVCNEMFAAALNKEQIQELLLVEAFSFVCNRCINDGLIDIPDGVDPYSVGYLTELWVRDEDLR